MLCIDHSYVDVYKRQTQGGIEKGIALLLDVTPQFYEAEPIKYEKLSLWYLFHYVRPVSYTHLVVIIKLRFSGTEGRLGIKSVV